VRTMVKTIRFFLKMALVATLASCGGGGGSGGTPIGGGDGGGGTTTAAADLTLALSAVSLRNTGTETLSATATAVDANRNALAGIAVTLIVDSNATVIPSGTQTDDRGEVTGEVGIGSDKSNRIITVTARSGTLEKTATFAVTGVKVTATAVPAQLASGASGQVQYKVLDVNSVPIPNIAVVIDAPGGESKGVTDINGGFNFDYRAPTTPGPFSISATAAGVASTTNLLVTGGNVVIPPAVGTVESASISASPDVVSVNTSASTNQAEIRALFVAADNSPITNIRVRFDLNGDVNSIGGTIAAGNNPVYSDTSGVARTTYRPGERSSPTGGVTIRACWDEMDFAAGSCPNSVTAKVTVVAEPLSVTIGANNLLENGVDDLTYIKRFVVQVVDSAGLAKSGVKITPTIDLPLYFKGQWNPTSDGWAQATQEPFGGCLNEDLDRDGRNDVYSNGSVEDANGSFNLVDGRPALEPRKADATISVDGSDVTDTSGKVILKMEYPKSVATWVTYNVVVSASVGGTEGRTNIAGLLGALADDSNDPGIVVPFRDSPYGIEPGDPASFVFPGLGTFVLCTNPN
jgi:hypothetical protein